MGEPIQNEAIQPDQPGSKGVKRFEWFANFKAASEADGGDLFIEGYASTFAEDREGETVAPDAFDGMLDEYKLNPVILVNHQNDVSSVVGSVVDMKTDHVGLWIKARIPDIKSDPVVQSVREKIKAGLLRAFSIGGLFQYEYPVIKKVKLLEISIVGVPANGYALFSVAKSMGLSFAEQAEQPHEGGEKQAEVQEAKKVSGATDLPLADRNRAWDAASAIKRVREWAGGDNFDQSKFAKAFFYYDESAPDPDGDGKPDAQSAYKLPFADVIGGELKAVPKAIFAVAAALQGARGGVDIPQSDMDGIKKKVARYYERMRKEFNDDSIVPPWENKSFKEDESMEQVKEQRLEQAEELKEVEQKAKEQAEIDAKAKAAEEQAVTQYYEEAYKAQLEQKLKEERARIEFPVNNKRAGNLSPAYKALLDIIVNRKSATMEYGEKALDTTTGAVWRNTELANEIMREIEALNAIRQSGARIISMPSNPYRVPLRKGRADVYVVNENTNATPHNFGSNNFTGDLTLTAKKLMAYVDITAEEEEDAIIPVLPEIRQAIVEGLNAEIENYHINGEVGGSPVSGVTGLFAAASVTHTAGSVSGSSATLAVASDFLKARGKLGKWGVNPNDLVLVVGPNTFNLIQSFVEAATIDKYGPNAAILTGETNKIFGISVLVSSAMKTSTQTYGSSQTAYKENALLFHKRAFLMGDRRQLTIKTMENITKDTLDVVGSVRIAHAPAFANAMCAITVVYDKTS